jgi:hypothetical protein
MERPRDPRAARHITSNETIRACSLRAIQMRATSRLSVTLRAILHARRRRPYGLCYCAQRTPTSGVTTSSFATICSTAPKRAEHAQLRRVCKLDADTPNTFGIYVFMLITR